MTSEQNIADIKKAIEDKKVIIGAECTMKSLKKGSIRIIYLAKNCPAGIKQDVAYYNKLAGMKVVQLEQPNDELGALCKKPFAVSIMGVKN